MLVFHVVRVFPDVENQDRRGLGFAQYFVILEIHDRKFLRCIRERHPAACEMFAGGVAELFLERCERTEVLRDLLTEGSDWRARRRRRERAPVEIVVEMTAAVVPDGGAYGIG